MMLTSDGGVVTSTYVEWTDEVIVVVRVVTVVCSLSHSMVPVVLSSSPGSSGRVSLCECVKVVEVEWCWVESECDVVAVVCCAHEVVSKGVNIMSEDSGYEATLLVLSSCYVTGWSEGSLEEWLERCVSVDYVLADSTIGHASCTACVVDCVCTVS